MQCLKPFQVGTANGPRMVRCRKCMPCRIRSREEWNARIQLESTDHQSSLFVTLTYSEENLPTIISQMDGSPVNTLVKRDTQLWLKRLRKALHPRTVRFFLCGEYGSNTGRAHYHAVLFGLSPSDAELVESSWGLGFVTSSELTPKRARYVARYTTKKLIGHTSYPDGRLPEFATMSRFPPLGKAAGQRIGQYLAGKDGLHTVPSSVSIGGKSLPLDHRLRGWIAEVQHAEYSEEDLELIAEVESYNASQNAKIAQQKLLTNAQIEAEEKRLRRIAEKGAKKHEIH